MSKKVDLEINEISLEEVKENIEQYELYNVIEEHTYYKEQSGDSLTCNIYYEDGNVIVELNKIDNDIEYKGVASKPYSEIQCYEQEDLNDFISSVLYYNMEEVAY